MWAGSRGGKQGARDARVAKGSSSTRCSSLDPTPPSGSPRPCDYCLQTSVLLVAPVSPALSAQGTGSLLFFTHTLPQVTSSRPSALSATHTQGLSGPDIPLQPHNVQLP